MYLANGFKIEYRDFKLVLMLCCVAVSVVLGVPTIKRERESYLGQTVQSLIDNLSGDEIHDCLIVVMICEVCGTAKLF